MTQKNSHQNQGQPQDTTSHGASLTLAAGDARCSVQLRRGAVVSSLILGGRELLKSPTADNAPWPGGGIPVLFPFAGRSWSDEPARPREVHHWTWNGQTRPMPIHGFVYTAEAPTWSRSSVRESQTLRLQCQDSAETRNLFPFAFTLALELTLQHQSLELRLVTRAGDVAMPMAPGFHPYFAQDLSADFQLEHADTVAFNRVTPEGNVGESGSLELPRSLNEGLLHNLIVHNEQHPWTVRHRSSGKTMLRLTHSGAWTVLWGKPELNFICIEPWTALPDAAKRSPLAGGALLLGPHESHELWVRIEVD